MPSGKGLSLGLGGVPGISVVGVRDFSDLDDDAMLAAREFDRMNNRLPPAEQPNDF
jgi:hypothetical protein